MMRLRQLQFACCVHTAAGALLADACRVQVELHLLTYLFRSIVIRRTVVESGENAMHIVQVRQTSDSFKTRQQQTEYSNLMDVKFDLGLLSVQTIPARSVSICLFLTASSSATGYYAGRV